MSSYASYETLRSAVDKAAQDIAFLGYPELLSTKIIVGTSEKYTSWLGITTKKKRTYEKGMYFIIQFNLPCMRVITDTEAKNIIYHEVAHCIIDGYCHTGEWKVCATKINQTYGLHVARTTDVPAYHSLLEKRDAAKIRYIPYCKDCGKEYRPYYSKGGKVVKSILQKEKRFYCTSCKSQNLAVKTVRPQF